MKDNALKAALANLLSHGDKMENSKLGKMAAAKKAPKPEPCPECGKPMMDGECEACGYETPQTEGSDDGEEMAGLLEQDGG